MVGPSAYERLQIESLLQRDKPPAIIRGCGLVMLPESERFMRMHEVAIVPAFRKCDLDAEPFVRVFDSDSALSTIGREIATAEIIIADVSTQSAHLMYVLGLCHAMGRCPILLTQFVSTLPFNLESLRFVEYEESQEGLIRLREELARAMRVFLIAARNNG